MQTFNRYHVVYARSIAIHTHTHTPRIEVHFSLDFEFIATFFLQKKPNHQQHNNRSNERTNDFFVFFSVDCSVFRRLHQKHRCRINKRKCFICISVRIESSSFARLHFQLMLLFMLLVRDLLFALAFFFPCFCFFLLSVRQNDFCFHRFGVVSVFGSTEIAKIDYAHRKINSYSIDFKAFALFSPLCS